MEQTNPEGNLYYMFIITEMILLCGMCLFQWDANKRELKCSNYIYLCYSGEKSDVFKLLVVI